ncbi:MAG: CapA family protein [Dehalococcoidia bacterium]
MPRRLVPLLLSAVLLTSACTVDEPGRPAAAASATLAATAAAAAPSPTAPAGPGMAWAAITDQRRDVLALKRDDVRAILEGRTTDWRALGGTEQPIAAYLERRDAEAVGRALGIAPGALRATLVEDGAVVATVARTPGALGLARFDALRPGALGLIVDGHDPYRDPAAESPLRTGGSLPAIDPVLIASPGELLPVRCANAALEQHGDFGVIFEGVKAITQRADIAVIGLDTPLTDLSPPTPCVSTFTLQGSAKSVPQIAAAGIDIVFTNGNHMLDCWEASRCPAAAGLRDTLKRLRDAGVAPVGAGESLEEARAPHVMQVGSGEDRVRVAFLAYDEIAPWNWATPGSPGTSPLKAEYVRADVAAARKVADVVVVATSWGIEYESVPRESQREIARAAFEAGAALVIGNHPHTVQAVELREGRLVTYALGNFLFDQEWSVPTTQSLVLEVGFIRGELAGYRLRPAVTRRLDAGGRRALFRPVLLDPAQPEGASIMQRVWRASDALR